MNNQPDSFEWDKELPVLSGRGLHLRGIRLTDASPIFSIYSDPEVCQLLDGRPMTEPEQATDYIKQVGQNLKTRLIFQWGICDSKEDQLFGTCSLYYLDYKNRRGEIGITLARSAWGQGLASEALRVLIEFAFNVVNLHRIEADIDPENSSSLALFERMGFQREGLLRERWQLPGKVHDTVLLGLLCREWCPDREPTAGE